MSHHVVTPAVDAGAAGAARSIAVEFDVPARMRDGTVLRADVYRPAGDGTLADAA